MSKHTQANSNIKHPYFAERLLASLIANNIATTPVGLATALNDHFKSTAAKPHTVRKWLLGETQPRSETLVLLAKMLKVKPDELISKPRDSIPQENKIRIEFDFSDQEVISKYLSMTAKHKAVVRLLIETLTEKRN